MAADVDDVVHASHDPEVAVFVFAGAVAGEVDPGNLRPVLAFVAFGIAVDVAQHPGPRTLDHEEATGTERDRFAVECDNVGHNPREGLGRGTRLGRNRAGNGRDHDLPGFRLPPGIDDRAAVVSDDFAIPHPRFRINGLADGPQQAQRIQLVLLRPLFAPLDESADGRGSGVEDGDLVAVDDGPEAVGLREVGRAFVHQRGAAVLQRTVHDVAVAGDPPNIGGAPVNIVVAQIEDPLGRDVGRHRVAASGVHHALRLAGGSRGVKDVERVLGLVRLGGTVVAGLRHQLVPPVVASGLHRYRRDRALVNDHVLHRRTRLERLIHRGFQLYFRTAAIGPVLGDDGDGLRVGDAVHQRVGREPSEDDRMRRADAGAGEHRDRQLRTHAHVDGDAVALFHAQALQDVGELLHFLEQFGVGDVTNLARLAFPNERGFAALAGQHVAIEAVVGEVDFAAAEPLHPRRVPLQHRVPGLEPVQFAGDIAPELFRILDGQVVDALVFLHALDVRFGRKLRWRRKLPLLLKYRINVVTGLRRRPCHCLVL